VSDTFQVAGTVAWTPQKYTCQCCKGSFVAADVMFQEPLILCSGCYRDGILFAARNARAERMTTEQQKPFYQQDHRIVMGFPR